MRALAAAVGILALAACDGSARDATGVLRVAVTTSTRDTGLLDRLIRPFEQQHGVRVDAIAMGTGKALKLGELGDVDVVFVHARDAEDRFMAAGHGVRHEAIMVNSFLLVGPPCDPAGIRQLDPAEAMRRIAAGGHPLVSRGDDSGTHKREGQLWNAAGGLTPWAGYVASGQGMGATLVMADQRQAYTLTDEGTFRVLSRKIELVELVSEGRLLANPYGAMAVNPAKNGRVNDELADAFLDFLISQPAQRSIRDLTIGGRPLFRPLRLER